MLEEKILKTSYGDVHYWIASKYEPLPTIVEAARTFMKNEPFDGVKHLFSRRSRLGS